MVELGDLPVLVIMTLRAVRTIATFMRIVIFMAAHTSQWRFFDVIVGAVTSGATGAGMRPEQCKSCIFVVIEIHRFPGRGRMTFGAIGAARTLVRIVTCMTGVAGALRFADRIIGTMTPGASGRSMFAGQRETGVAVVIERG